MAANNGVTGRLQIGVGLISISVALGVVAIVIAGRATDNFVVRIAILILAASLIGLLWVAALRNGEAERAAIRRLRAEHPGSLVERVRLWSLPKGRVDKDIPVHFLVADAGEILFETIDRTALLRIPVAEIGFLDPVTAQGDRVRDRALTIIYGDDQDTVQVFTLTYTGIAKLGARLRKAIGWPADGIPTR